MNPPQLSYADFGQAARELGFCAYGIAPAEPVIPQYAEAFRQWIALNHHADMRYMTNYEEQRLNPRLLLPGAQSILVVALNYYPEKRLSDSQLQFAYYAYGKDYHDVMRERLRRLAESLGLCEEGDHSEGKHPLSSERFLLCCDTKPFLDRYWAMRAGLGWIGKNTNLIIPKAGSFCFLGAIITTLQADRYDHPMPDRCGTCDRCLQACPTHALCAPRQLDARRCLSYLTIENRQAIPSQYVSSLSTCIYGCDRCQKVCPHNRQAQPTQVAEFSATDEFLAMQPSDWQQLTPETYRRLFRGSAVKRAKYEGLIRNIQAACDK